MNSAWLFGFFHVFFPQKSAPGAQDVLKTLQEECSLLATSSEVVGWFQGFFSDDLRMKNRVYPLVNVDITMERSTIFHGKIHELNGYFP